MVSLVCEQQRDALTLRGLEGARLDAVALLVDVAIRRGHPFKAAVGLGVFSRTDGISLNVMEALLTIAGTVC